MPTRLFKTGTDKGAWGMAQNDAMRALMGIESIKIVLNGNNPPTVKSGSKFYVFDTETYLTPAVATGNNVYPSNTSTEYNLSQAIYEQADRTFSWSAGSFPALANSTTYYLYCSGSEDVDATSRGKGLYGAGTTAPTYDSNKEGWYLVGGERVLAIFKTSGAGVVYQLTVLKAVKYSNEIILDSVDYTISDSDGISVINMTTGASNRTITLPTLADNLGREITIIKVDAGAGTVITDGEGAETINGSTTFVISARYNTATLIAAPDGWYVKSDIIGGAWTAYTPSLTNFTIGTGVSAINSGFYIQRGKIVYLRHRCILGTSGQSVGAGVTIALPVTAATYGTLTAIGTVLMTLGGVTSTGIYYSDGTVRCLKISATYYMTPAALSATQPATWAAGDSITIEGFYEAA